MQDPCLSSEPDLTKAVFRRRRARSLRRGRRSISNAFLVTFGRGNGDSLAFAYDLTCLEQGYFTGARFKRLLVVGEDLASSRATAAQRSTATEVSLAKSCQNQMVFSSMMLSNPTMRRRERTTLKVTRPYMRWFEQQLRELRSAQAAIERGTRQLLRDEFLRTIAESLSLFSKLPWIGAKLRCRRSHRRTQSEVGEEDWLCTGMCDLAMAVAGARIVRHAWYLWGWSARSALLLRLEPRSRPGQDHGLPVGLAVVLQLP